MIGVRNIITVLVDDVELIRLACGGVGRCLIFGFLDFDAVAELEEVDVGVAVVFGDRLKLIVFYTAVGVIRCD